LWQAGERPGRVPAPHADRSTFWEVSRAV